jgi:hypothetical protein
MGKDVVVFGWFSAIQAYKFGTCRYSTPDGKEVTVTEVTDSKEYSSHWPDVTYVGPVVHCIAPNERWAAEEREIEKDPFGYARNRLAELERERKINSHGMN